MFIVLERFKVTDDTQNTGLHMNSYPYYNYILRRIVDILLSQDTLFRIVSKIRELRSRWISFQ